MNDILEDANIVISNNGETPDVKIDDTEYNHKENLIVENADIEWKGDPRYFQTGKKAGQLKPSAQVGGVDANKAQSDPIEFKGLNTDDLKATASKNKAKAEQAVETKKRETKAEKRLVEGKIASALVMRALDLLVDWMSGGTYGQGFSQQQTDARLTYREQLQTDWEIYLSTLDIPLHPALVVSVGSVMYVAPALNTPVGASKIDKIKAWIYSRWANRGAK